MKKRQKRLTAIADILLNNIVGSQDELLELLLQGGYDVTQATLSRDLKTLRTSKIPTEMGRYRYVMGGVLPPDKDVEKGAAGMVSRAAIESVTMSGQLLVIRTRNGYAGGVAYDIDDLHSPYFMGTIAGADTVIVVLAENVSHSEILAYFQNFFPPKVIAAALDAYCPPAKPQKLSL